MSSIESVVIRFYEGFVKKDSSQMAECYADTVTFSDPVFPNLKGEEARKMWRMLCSNGKDLKVTYEILASNDSEVYVHWDAYYTFSGTGRKVHNSINTVMTVKDGLITKHQDQFNFWKWSSQALGPIGILLGWTPFLQAKIQAKAKKSLERFQSTGN